MSYRRAAASLLRLPRLGGPTLGKTHVNREPGASGASPLSNFVTGNVRLRLHESTEMSVGFKAIAKLTYTAICKSYDGP